jgi:3-hydroxyisobutyrate dehydrogenase
MKIGYVGLGHMGGALARRIQLQRELQVFDLDAAAVQRLVEKGAVPCPSLAELGQRCDIVLLCLPTSDQVRTVLLGENGLAASLRRGSLVVDQTSGDPTATRAMAAELALRGIELIDAPVSGGPRGADAGTIAIMVGASDAQYERVLPILQTISPNILHAGGVGTGHVAKLANNLLSGGQRLMTLEAMALAVKNGISPDRAADIFPASSGRNYWAEHFLKSHIITGKLDSPFTLGLLHKDVRLACKLADDSGVSLFLGNQVKGYYQSAINELGEHAPVNTVALVLDRLSGAQVVPGDHYLE